MKKEKHISFSVNNGNHKNKYVIDSICMILMVLCTYNGVSKIERQLDSLRDQTMQPYEMLIFEDASKDQTVETVRSYIENNSLNGWIITARPKNLGWRKNYLEILRETAAS